MIWVYVKVAIYAAAGMMFLVTAYGAWVTGVEQVKLKRCIADRSPTCEIHGVTYNLTYSDAPKQSPTQDIS
jgi:hypothetical protein